MDKYIEMIRIRFLMMLAYRTNYYSGILIYSINIGAYYFLWTAIYGGKESIEGLSVVQMTSYIAVSWMARAFYFNNIDREIALEIKEGKVAVELIRPYNYLGMKTMQAFGEGVFRLVFFSLPGMVIVGLVFPMEFSTNGATWLFFACSLVFSFIINTQINLITGLLTFFLFNNDGLMRAKRVIIDLFSGLLLPISFYPLWAQNIMQYFPFQAISYIPSMIFTEGIEGNEVFQAILLQGMWAIILLIPIQMLWISAKKRMIIQGG
ncbi:ABC transporter permease [Metabacillus sediminilitoris]|uniref:Daunorubicin ABC transporter permease n=1 Tax=Metabacillus sediminilitoris TaxID=2567941 RepID=A0A4V3WEZ9_9BACI|nr:ABC-2 family transporter protein [Metabacillus sediminilitoris]QGQ44331.1 daunorubicin ABC transporter permease [Metabacillus sediminilitoris]THF78295.1 daunorubicin ABC transporter permease [Metabacillus sediminilitoris]